MGSRNESDSPDAWTEAWPGHSPIAMKQVADVRARDHAPDARRCWMPACLPIAVLPDDSCGHGREDAGVWTSKEHGDNLPKSTAADAQAVTIRLPKLRTRSSVRAWRRVLRDEVSLPLRRSIMFRRATKTQVAAADRGRLSAHGYVTTTITAIAETAGPDIPASSRCRLPGA